jgi:hypothetical protein
MLQRTKHTALLLIVSGKRENDREREEKKKKEIVVRQSMKKTFAYFIRKIRMKENRTDQFRSLSMPFSCSNQKTIQTKHAKSMSTFVIDAR